MNSNNKKYILINLAVFLAILCIGSYFAYKMPDSLIYIFSFVVIFSGLVGGFMFKKPDKYPKNKGVQIFLNIVVIIIYLSLVIGYLYGHPLSEVIDPNTAVLNVVIFGTLSYAVIVLIVLISVYTDKIVEIFSKK